MFPRTSHFIDILISDPTFCHECIPYKLLSLCRCTAKGRPLSLSLYLSLSLSLQGNLSMCLCWGWTAEQLARRHSTKKFHRTSNWYKSIRWNFLHRIEMFQPTIEINHSTWSCIASDKKVWIYWSMSGCNWRLTRDDNPICRLFARWGKCYWCTVYIAHSRVKLLEWQWHWDDKAFFLCLLQKTSK